MCPVCLANMVLIAACVTSTGGLTALVARKVQKTAAKKNDSKIQIKGEQNENRNS